MRKPPVTSLLTGTRIPILPGFTSSYSEEETSYTEEPGFGVVADSGGFHTHPETFFLTS